jgi:hypothetical protein
MSSKVTSGPVLPDNPINHTDPTGNGCESGNLGAAAFLGGSAEIGIHSTALALGEDITVDTGVALTTVSEGLGALVAGVAIASVVLAGCC